MNTYLHIKKDNKKSILIYFLCLLPLVFYGMYKNGYLLYQNGFGNIEHIFRPLLMVVIATILNFLIDLIIYRKISLNYHYIEAITIVLFLPPTLSLKILIPFLTGSLLICEFLERKFSINKIALGKLIIILACIFLGNYTYMNNAEASGIYAYNLFDYIWGRNISGIASSSVLIGIIIYIVLACFTNYKKIIPLISYVIYFGLTFLIMVIKNNIIWENLFSSTVILALILVSTSTLSTPYRREGEVTYAIILGILATILTYYLPYEGIFIAILITSLFNLLINRIWRRIREIENKKIKYYHEK